MFKKKMLNVALTTGLLAGGFIPMTAYAEKSEVENYLQEIVKLQPNVASEQVLKEAEIMAKSQNMKVEEVLRTYLKEATNNAIQGREEAENTKEKSDFQTLGGSGGVYTITNSTKGNIYYTPSQTAYLDHGHVGMYYLSDTIVESVPSTGVRTIKTSNRLVDAGAVIQTVSTSTQNKQNAANWAYSEVGESYSYNFMNNRNTGHDGAKNCSKLVWSAFLLKANIDIDKDGGFGVYPRDIRDSNYTSTIKTF
ncbi:YiiX/YebB-like N1pC/P60 family cysteine hydrolase [Bacillus wiedmannii]|uniref:YiiX/YebB-like N1pC/P60 family cysteine hydrolase n=1 Tax=Bacillus wiedmannii TaxID=1890302 RepID=UPI003000A5E3